MDFETIRFESNDGVAVITLNRPDSLNAFTDAMHAELRHAMDAIEGDADLRALVITGAGRAFCSGANLAGVAGKIAKGAELDAAAVLDDDYHPLIKRLRALELPVIVAVNGIAAGAGCNFALVGDIVLAARSAEFIQVFVRIGVIPDAGGTYYLPRLIGPARARALCMLGEPLPAERAAEWGLIWKCVDDEALMDEAMGLAKRLATQPTRAIAIMKQALEVSFDNDMADQLDVERDGQVAAFATEDFREGVTAFIEKRKAVFKGR